MYTEIHYREKYNDLDCVKNMKYKSKDLELLTDNDSLLKFFKYDYRNNYKPYLYHSLGVFENEISLELKY